MNRRWLLSILLLAPALAVLYLHARHYLPFISDDALISLRYAERLLEGKGLTWTDGVPVEGYSNLLWILLASLLGRLGVDLILAVRLLGFAGMALVVAAFAYLHATRRVGWFAAAVGASFVVLSGPVAAWTVGGLEQPLVAALLAWSIVFLLDVIEGNGRPVMVVSVLLGLLCLTRPDGPVFAAAAAAAVFVAHSDRRAALILAARILSIPVLLCAAQLIFRLSYYGEWVPNSALIKITPSPRFFAIGLFYLGKGLIALLPFSIIGALAIVFMMKQRSHRKVAVLFTVIALAWASYLVFIGGDIFPAYRHLVPVVVVLAFATTYGLDRLAHERPRRLAEITGLAAVVGISGALFVLNQFNNAENTRAREEVWEWEGEVVGGFLRAAFPEKEPLLAVTAAGCLPYWSKLPCIDMLGLNDYYIPRHPPETIGRGYLGHEFGDGGYVLGRRPDLVIFCGPAGKVDACFRSGWEMQQRQEFREEYTLVTFFNADPVQLISRVYVRRYSEKIGIQTADNRLVIPAYLFNEGKRTAAYLNAAEKLVVAVAESAPASISLALSDANWEAQARVTHPPGAVVRADVESQPGGRTRIVLTTTAPTPVEVSAVTLTARGEGGPGSNE